MTAVKICGLTRESDVELAVALGAQYLGFNFAAGSPRRIGVGAGARLAAAAGRRARRVGVFADEREDEIGLVVGTVGLDLLQFHRAVREEDFRWGLPVVGAVAIAPEGGRIAVSDLGKRCRAVLLDTCVAGRSGGTAKTFAWKRARIEPGAGGVPPLWIAGGLEPDNVAEAIRILRPEAVDVATGVESAPGVKDEARMRRFFEEVERADAIRR